MAESANQSQAGDSPGDEPEKVEKQVGKIKPGDYTLHVLI
jgi:hypothetical protein